MLFQNLTCSLMGDASLPSAATPAGAVLPLEQEGGLRRAWGACRSSPLDPCDQGWRKGEATRSSLPPLAWW
jgi:hypothetical protein